jgi:hypothetical protein
MEGNAMINKTEHLMIVLSEECAELSKEVSKALRFGLNDREPGQDLTNREKIINEFNDLFSVMNMLKDYGVFEDKELLTISAIEGKKNKVLKYMEYAESVGKLEWRGMP